MNFFRYIQELFNYDASSPMIFNSGAFLALFIVFIAIYAIIHKNRIAITLFVIGFSLLFYYKSSGWYLWILVFTTITDFSFALAITEAKKKIFKQIWLFLSVGVSLGILFYFKYTNFFLGNFYAIAGNNFQPLDIFLPIGISFYTFQSISYVLDVYWKKLEPTKNILDYAFYLTFFPQLVAGPIVKANLFLPQLKKPITIKKDEVYAGLWLIMIGLFKKAVIADYISQYNDLVFGDPSHYSGFENLMAVYGYTLQIYCDFSGYSDMAIGLGKIMGFDLGINFNFPYKAYNITDFWRRWHISLSSWLRDYLYIPLGGNRKGKVRMYINLFITMFLGGLWHGASWKFVFWGAWHGVALAIHKGTKKVLDKIPNKWPSNSASWFLTFHFVIFLWIFFRANNIEHEVYKHNEQLAENTRTESSINYNDGNNELLVKIFRNDSLINTVTKPLDIKENNLVIRTEIVDGIETIKVNQVEDAFNVAWSMINKIATDTDFTYAWPFLKVRYIWVILLVIGFVMHSTPTNWNQKIMEGYVRAPYLLKVFVFVILVQLVVQFKSEDVQPFIYFQF
jgi:alginate O-acetyltransferase complex protein AlgI